MHSYSVYVGFYFLKCFTDADSAYFLEDSLNYFFENEDLPYRAVVRCDKEDCHA